MSARLRCSHSCSVQRQNRPHIVSAISQEAVLNRDAQKPVGAMVRSVASGTPMKHHTVRLVVLLLCTTAGLPATAQHVLPGAAPSTGMLAGPPTASSFAYPQSIFVDSQNGEMWIADFDNNRVLRFDVSSLTGAAEPTSPLPPEMYALSQNYPNPFNPSTTITFALENTEQATVTVYTVLGQEVATLFRGIAAAHVQYAFSFDATHLPSGMYFYALRSAHRYEVRKMGVMK